MPYFQKPCNVCVFMDLQNTISLEQGHWVRYDHKVKR